MKVQWWWMRQKTLHFSKNNSFWLLGWPANWTLLPVSSQTGLFHGKERPDFLSGLRMLYRGSIWTIECHCNQVSRCGCKMGITAPLVHVLLPLSLSYPYLTLYYSHNVLETTYFRDPVLSGCYSYWSPGWTLINQWSQMWNDHLSISVSFVCYWVGLCIFSSLPIGP